MQIKLFTDFHYFTEIEDVVKLFGDVIRSDEKDADLCVTTHTDGNLFVAKAVFGENTHVEEAFLPADELARIRYAKRTAKVATYRVISQSLGVKEPWGSLTGIRPTKLAYQLISEGVDFKQAFAERFDVSQEKIQLVSDILEQQKGLRVIDDKSADLYVGVPFCVSRCSYCSFTSGELGKMMKFVEPYVDKLCYEIRQTLDFARANGMKIKNVYFGGGTPTSLSVAQLKRIFDKIDVKPVEFCVEAGRPDTIDEDKLKLFSDYGVNRVSINPQTFNESILVEIGRNHTIGDIYDRFELARTFDFDINMDLIAGLPKETYEMFCFSVDSVVSMAPENVTIHTLALKSGSLLKLSGEEKQDGVKKMVQYAHKTLQENGYKPYYLYRQKYMSDNLENVGFCKENKQCLYNIDIMEETSNILACGTNAISKRVISLENRIERSANPKDVVTYLNRLDDFIEKKKKLFE